MKKLVNDSLWEYVSFFSDSNMQVDRQTPLRSKKRLQTKSTMVSLFGYAIDFVMLARGERQSSFANLYKRSWSLGEQALNGLLPSECFDLYKIAFGVSLFSTVSLQTAQLQKWRVATNFLESDVCSYKCFAGAVVLSKILFLTTFTYYNLGKHYYPHD